MNRTKINQLALLGAILLATVTLIIFLGFRLMTLAHQVIAAPSNVSYPVHTPTQLALPSQPSAAPLSIVEANVSSALGASATPSDGVNLSMTTVPATDGTDRLLSVTTETAAPSSPSPVGATVANQRAVVDLNLVNVRSAPSIAGELLAQLKKADTVEILASSTDNQWYKICCPLGTNAVRESWISAAHIRLLPAPAPVTAERATGDTTAQAVNQNGLRGVVTASVINIRGGPGTHYASAGQLSEGAILMLVGRSESSEWLQFVLTEGGEPGWVHADLVTIDGADAVTITALPISPAPILPAAQTGN